MFTTTPEDHDVSMTDPSSDTASTEQASTDTPVAAGGSSMDIDPTDDATHISNISTAAVKKYFQIVNQIDEGQLELASTPYNSLNGNPPSFLPDLKIATIYAAKVLTGQLTLTDVNKEYYWNNGITLKQWISCMMALKTCNFDNTEVLNGEEVAHFKVLLSRMGHTPPSCLFHICQSVTAATPASRAWRAAVATIGSHYLKKKPDNPVNPKKRQVQTMLTTDNDSRLSLSTSVSTTAKAVTITPSKSTGKRVSTPATSKSASTRATTSSKGNSTRATGASTKQDKRPAKLQNFPVADSTEAFLAKQDSEVTRTMTPILIKLHLEPGKENDTTDQALATLGSMLEAYQKRDPHVVFLPWSFENWASLPPHHGSSSPG
jgi:hypothetical protein